MGLRRRGTRASRRSGTLAYEMLYELIVSKLASREKRELGGFSWLNCLFLNDGVGSNGSASDEQKGRVHPESGVGGFALQLGVEPHGSVCSP